MSESTMGIKAVEVDRRGVAQEVNLHLVGIVEERLG